MDDRFSLEKNHWQIQDPEWAKIPHVWMKDVHWCGIRGIDNYWLQGKDFNGRLYERFPVSWPSTAEHMYFIWWYIASDYVFASYSLAEIKRFLQIDIDVISRNYWKNSGICTSFFIYDMVQKKWYAFKHDNLDVYYEVRYPLDTIADDANTIEVKQNGT